MTKAGFELSITASERSKTVRASDRSATATGSEHLHSHKFSETYTADANDPVARAICMVAVEI
jgi:hypothetical protein